MGDSDRNSEVLVGEHISSSDYEECRSSDCSSEETVVEVEGSGEKVKPPAKKKLSRLKYRQFAVKQKPSSSKEKSSASKEKSPISKEKLNTSIEKSRVSKCTGDKNLSSGEISPASKGKLSAFYVKYPALKEILSIALNKSPASKDKTSASKAKSPASKAKSPSSKGKSPASKGKSSTSEENSPASKEKLNASIEKSPDSQDKSSPSKEKSCFSKEKSSDAKDTKKCIASLKKDKSESFHLCSLVGRLELGEMKYEKHDVCDSTCEVITNTASAFGAKDNAAQVEEPTKTDNSFGSIERYFKPRELDFFLERVTVDMVSVMAKDANENRKKVFLWKDGKDITSEELYRFFGLTILMIRDTRLILEYWSKDPLLRTEIFSKTMPEKRYSTILNNLQLTPTGNEYPLQSDKDYIHIPHQIQHVAMFLNNCITDAQNAYDIKHDTRADRSYFQLNLSRQLLDKSNISKLKEKKQAVPTYEEDSKMVAKVGKSSLELETSAKDDTQLDDTSNSEVLSVDKSPIDYFLEQVTPEMVSAITMVVNNEGLDEMETSESNEWEVVTDPELYRFFGLTMLMLRSVRISLADYWSKDPLLPTEIFSRIMSEERYRFLLPKVHLNPCDEYPDDDESYYSHIPVEIRHLAQFLTNRLMEAQLNYEFDKEVDANISQFELDVIQQLLDKFSVESEDSKIVPVYTPVEIKATSGGSTLVKTSSAEFVEDISVPHCSKMSPTTSAIHKP